MESTLGDTETKSWTASEALEIAPRALIGGGRGQLPRGMENGEAESELCRENQ